MTDSQSTTTQPLPIAQGEMHQSVEESSRDNLTDEGHTNEVPSSIASLIPPPDTSGSVHSQNFLHSLHLESVEEPANVQKCGISAAKGTDKGKGKDSLVHSFSHDDLRFEFHCPPLKYRRKGYHVILENDFGLTEEERKTATDETALPPPGHQSSFNENVKPVDTAKRTRASRRRGLNTGTRPPTRTSARLRDKAASKSDPRDTPNATSPTTENLYRTLPPLQGVVVDLNGTARISRRVESASIELVGQCVMEPSSAYFGPQDNLPPRFRFKLMTRKP